MRLLSLTAGAAAMYCGSCLRDNALAAELIRRGHDVTLLPFYTPTLTDEVNVSRQERVFFGGISVYLQQHLALFRHTPRLLDRLWDSPGVIKTFSQGSIAVDPKFLGAMTVSTLRGEHGNQRKEIEKLLEWLTGEPRPDLINIPYALLIALAAPLKRALGCPIVMTLQGEDLFLEGMPQEYRDEAIALIQDQIRHIDLFIAVSEYYAAFMRDYLAIPADKIRVAGLGITLDEVPAPAALARQPFTVGYLARIAPEKGLHVLAEAYRLMRLERGLPAARLRAAGYLPPEHAGYLAAIQRDLAEAGLGGEFDYAGAPDRQAKFTFLRTLDVFSVPSPYHEPKGMPLLEAMACGVPVVQPPHGAFPEILAKTGGGVLADSASPADVATRLMELWHDPARARALGAGGQSGVHAHYSVGRMTDAVLAAFREAVGAST